MEGLPGWGFIDESSELPSAAPHAAALALACMEPAILRECSSAFSMRCAFGVLEALRTSWAALPQGAARQDSTDAVKLQLERLGDALQPTVVQYAFRVLAVAVEKQPNGDVITAVTQAFELQPVLRLLTAMPSLLGAFLTEVLAALDSMTALVSGSDIHAMRLLCEVLSVQELRSSLLELRVEVLHVVGALRDAAGAPEHQVTAVGRAAADAGQRLEGMRRTLFGEL